MRNLWQARLYLGCIFAPILIFFAISAILHASKMASMAVILIIAVVAEVVAAARLGRFHYVLICLLVGAAVPALLIIFR